MLADGRPIAQKTAGAAGRGGHEPFARGHPETRAIRGRKLAGAPDVHRRLVNRICHGPFVIDHGEVTGVPGGDRTRAVGICEVVEGKIARAWFLR